MPEDSCVLCQIVKGKVPALKIYEDEDTLAVLDINGANIGHCFVIPKEHFPIFEQVPDELTGKLFKVANAISTAIFETLKIEGTNIFVSNGVVAGQTVAHFMINVIPRRQDDGINLQWQPKQLNQEEMSTVELRLKEQASGGHEFKKDQPAEHKEPVKKKAAPIIEGDDNYLLKQLRRIP